MDCPTYLLDFHNPHLSNENTAVRGEAQAQSPVTTQPPSIHPTSIPKMILWNLPLSYPKYPKCVAPNVVAPPSIHPLLLYSNFPSLSLCNDMPSPYSSFTYPDWMDVYPPDLRPQMPPVPRPSEARNSLSYFPPNPTVFYVPV